MVAAKVVGEGEGKGDGEAWCFDTGRCVGCDRAARGVDAAMRSSAEWPTWLDALEGKDSVGCRERVDVM